MLRKTGRCIGITAALTALVASAVMVSPAAAADPPFIDPSSDWLTTVNYFRAMANLAPVVESPVWSASAAKHSCYMLANGISHDEVAGNPGYSTDGQQAGLNGNVAVSSAINTTSRSHIELWMTGPFHAIGILRPGLKSVGFGVCNQPTTPTPWHSGATLDVLHGLVQVPQTAPIVWPGNGTTTSLSQFITESPNPLDYCGWTGQPAGLPIIALMPEGFSGNPVGTITGSNGIPVDSCVISSKNTTSTAQQILNGNNAVVIIPHARLGQDTYSVSITTSARNVSWSFTVDPAAATGVLPAPVTLPLATGNTLHVISPTRIVDTRANVGSTALVGTLTKRIQITGRGGVPDGAQAISANFTATNAAAAGFLTAW
ncbi:MAG: Hemolysin-type calcium-binding region, partial [Acidimicrobiales bacterium]|nr:Hemolysin-type calcium-binding region [Acidimicrobiales bacterium]